MPRNGSGTYTLPQAPFTPGTTISSSAVNADLSDIANALTQSLSADGQTPLIGSLNFPPGGPTHPSVTFNSDTSSGLFSPGAGKVGIAAGGSTAVVIDSTVENTGNGDILQYGNGSLLNPVGMVSDFAGTVAPPGWLLCFGQTLSTAAYPELYSVIGVAYGGSTGTFKLPDLRGRGTYGKDNMGGTTAGRITSTGTNFDGTLLGNAGGGQEQILTTSNLPNTNFALAATSAGSVSIGGGQGSHVHSGSTAYYVGTTTVQFPLSGGNIAPASGTNSWVTQTATLPAMSGTYSGSVSGHASSGGNDTPFSTLSPALILNKIIFAGRP